MNLVFIPREARDLQRGRDGSMSSRGRLSREVRSIFISLCTLDNATLTTQTRGLDLTTGRTPAPRVIFKYRLIVTTGVRPLCWVLRGIMKIISSVASVELKFHPSPLTSPCPVTLLTPPLSPPDHVSRLVCVQRFALKAFPFVPSGISTVHSAYGIRCSY